jgi:hypothetical protein
MDKCTYSATLEALLTNPMARMGLIGAEDEDVEDTDDTEDGDEDDEDEDDSDDEDEDDGDESDSDADKSKSKKKKDGAKSESERKIENLTEDRNRQFHKRKAAEKKVTELTARVADLEKNGTKDEELKTKLTKAEEDATKLQTTNARLSLENAFLRDNTYDWANPTDAFKLLDTSDVDEDGTGLKAALDKLATEKKYLLKAEEPKPRQRRKTGETPSGGKKKQTEAQREAELRKKYPNL